MNNSFQSIGVSMNYFRFFMLLLFFVSMSIGLVLLGIYIVFCGGWISGFQNTILGCSIVSIVVGLISISVLEDSGR